MAAGRLVMSAGAAGAALLLAALALGWPEPAPVELAGAAAPAHVAPAAAPAVRAKSAASVVRPAVLPLVAAPVVGLPALLAAPAQFLRASLQAALRERASGGRLYARALTRQCATVNEAAAVLDVTDPRAQRALAQQAALAAGCAQLLVDEWLALASVPADEPGTPDPLLRTLESDASSARLVAVLARPDPLLLDELGAQLLGETPSLDGRHFETAQERSLLEAALRLLPCDFGLVCDERDPSVWQACLRGEGCHASRAAQVLASHAGGDPAREAEIVALHVRLRDAFRAGAIERFLR